MYAQHHRFAIFNANQHPYRHALSEFPYSNDAMPAGEVYNAQQALDWVMAVLYPNHQAAVATVADLPAAGNTVNDYRVVNDDGDGKSAGYRWEQREGEAAPSWHKIYDMDWGTDSVLQAWQARTQDLFVFRKGYDDLDDAGVALAGVLAGQHIYGGASANGHLTLHANSGDGAGAQTGFVQLADDLRPTADSARSLGTDTERWLKVWTDELAAGTLTAGAGSISDSSGLIDFGVTNLTTAGYVEAGTLKIASGSITDSAGEIDFDNENLVTTGTVEGGAALFTSVTATGAVSTFASGTMVGNLTLADGLITDSSGAISFGADALSTTGAAAAGELTVDNLHLDGNTISATAGDLDLTAAGVIALGAAMTTLDVSAVGTVTVAGQFNADNLRIDGNVLSSTNADGSIDLAPNGTGWVSSSAKILPTADGTLDLGAAAARWETLYLATGLGDGTDLISMATLVSFRDALVGAAAGMTLFFDGDQWLASLPDTEIDHGAIDGLGDDDHTQYALLSGRAGGQILIGGTAAGDDLLIESTSDAAKGTVQFGSTIHPIAAADLGTAALPWVDAYQSGQFYGLRLPNYTTALRPAASAGNKGRLVWDTDLTAVYADQGGSWVKVGAEKVTKSDAVTWDGLTSTKTYTVDGTDGTITGKVSDARLAVWVLKDNSDDYKQVGCDITATATTVTVTVGEPLPAGTYTLIGVG